MSEKRKISRRDWAAISLAAFFVAGALFAPFFIKITGFINNIPSYEIYDYANKKIEKSSFTDFILVFVGFGQLWWLARQTRIVRVQADMQRAQQRAFHRPRMVVRKITYSQSWLKGDHHRITISFLISNSGSGSAISAVARCGHALVAPGGAINGVPDFDNFLEIPHQFCRGAFNQYDYTICTNPSDIAAIVSKKKDFLFYGEIGWKEDGGTHGRTGFVRRYDPSTQRFYSANDPDYEYED